MADNEDQQQQPQEVPEAQPEATEQEDASPQGAVTQQPETASDEAAEPESEPAAQQQEAGGGEDEGEAGQGEDVQEVITISHEDNPNWLSAEECAARRIPQEQISSFQHAYFQHAYTIKTWYEALSQHTFTTEFIELSSEEVNTLIAASHTGQSEQPELSDIQRETLEQIEKKLNDAIEKFEGDGGFIRVNDRNPTDAILERNDAEFVARVRDAVINELEVFKQSANAYHIWHEQGGKQDGAFRRGMSRIRQSFRRQRAPSTSSSAKKEQQTVKLEDTTGQGEEEKKPEEVEAAAAVETIEQPSDKAGEEEGEGGGGGEGKGEGEGEGEGEKKSEEAAVTVEDEVTEEKAEDEQKEEEKTGEDEEQAQKQGEDAGALKTDDENKDDEGEIEKAPEQEAEESKPKREELPPVRKIKSESLDNEVLRAFGRAVTIMYRVASGKEALDMLLRSGLTKQYLVQLKEYGEVEGLSATISVTRFHADIARYPGMVLRGFVYEGELTALSQKHDNVTFFPNVAQYKNIILYKIKQFYGESVTEALAERGNYVIDFFVSAEKVYIIRLSPFYTETGSCLFTWAESSKQLTQPPTDFKLVEAPGKAPDLYSGLQSQWSSMLESVLQQKQNDSQSSNRSCTIL